MTNVQKPNTALAMMKNQHDLNAVCFLYCLQQNQAKQATSAMQTSSADETSTLPE
jgi:hypothetical protein